MLKFVNETALNLLYHVHSISLFRIHPTVEAKQEVRLVQTNPRGPPNHELARDSSQNVDAESTLDLLVLLYPTL